MKTKSMIAVAISGGLLIGCNGGSNSSSTPAQNGLSFSKVGTPITSLDDGEYTISANNGIINLVAAPKLNPTKSIITLFNINETATSKDNANSKEITIPESYVFQGGVVVSNDTNNVYIPVLSPNNKYEILSFNNTDETFTNLGTYITKWNMMQSYGYEANDQLYMLSDDGTGKNGNLCWLSAKEQNQTATCTTNGVLPTWYTGRYLVDNMDVYYGTESALFISSLTGNAHQIGQNANELIKQNYQLAFPLPQLYQNNIYVIGVDVINDKPILCHINKNADSNTAWQCAVEISNILDGDISLTDFYIDKITGTAVISTVDENANVQLYKAKL